jgi:hypothetical protein
LGPCDFFLFVCIKERVKRTNFAKKKELLSVLSEFMSQIPPDMILRVFTDGSQNRMKVTAAGEMAVGGPCKPRARGPSSMLLDGECDRLTEHRRASEAGAQGGRDFRLRQRGQGSVPTGEQIWSRIIRR